MTAVRRPERLPGAVSARHSSKGIGVQAAEHEICLGSLPNVSATVVPSGEIAGAPRTRPGSGLTSSGSAIASRAMGAGVGDRRNSHAALIARPTAAATADPQPASRLVQTRAKRRDLSSCLAGRSDQFTGLDRCLELLQIISQILRSSGIGVLDLSQVRDGRYVRDRAAATD